MKVSAEIISEGFFSVRLVGGEQATLRGANDALTQAQTKGALFHFENFLPLHFTHAGAARYGYRKRQLKYERQKRRRFGHTYPLVFSGESQRQALSGARIMATPKGARSMVTVPRSLIVHRATDPNKAQELGTVLPEEMQKVANVVGLEFAALVRDAPKRLRARKKLE